LPDLSTAPIIAARARLRSISKKLAPEERLRLIGELWDSLRARPETVPLTRPQRDELDRRLDELEQGKAGLVPWHEVKQRLNTRSG
jgi:putative addiction module component (TIGR02574 family)